MLGEGAARSWWPTRHLSKPEDLSLNASCIHTCLSSSVLLIPLPCCLANHSCSVCELPITSSWLQPFCASPQAGGSLCSAGCWEHCYPQMHSPPVQPLSDLQPAIDQKDLSLICVSRPLGLCLRGSLTSFYFLAEVVCTLICFKAIKIFEGWECYFHVFFPGGQFSDFSQFSPVAQSCLTLCNPMDCSTPGFPVHHQLPELAQTHVHRVGDAIQPPHPLSSPSPPAFNLSQHQSLWVSSSHQVAKVLELQFQHQSFQWIFRTEFL